MARIFPAEWSKQDAVMITWPHKNTDWAPFLSAVEDTYLSLSKLILTQQSLLIVCHDTSLKLHIITRFNELSINLAQVHFVICQTNDTWARDHGPIHVIEQQKLLSLDFTFNGWGNKYASQYDNQINQAVFTQLAIKNTQSIPLVLEGGGIESDGKGTLLTTSECLLNENRNPTLTKHQLEQQLNQYLGVNHFLWLDHGFLDGDDTDSHIDTLARFAPNDGIVYVGCDDANDIHYESLKKMKVQLSEFKTQSAKPYTLFELPWPSAKYNDDNERLPATYANYLIINNMVIVPTYQDKQDQYALEIIGDAYPEHQVIGLDCCSLIQQFGSLHCITMQIPHGFLTPSQSTQHDE